MKSIPVSQLLTARVYDKDGVDIGHVEDVAIHPVGQRLAHYVVVVRREVAEEVGLAQPTVTGEYRLHLHTEHVLSIGPGRVVARDDKWALAQMPRERA